MVRFLIGQLEGMGVTLCLDALHTQKKTIEVIVESQNHYVAQVKRNQRSLFTQLEEVVRLERPLDQYQQEEKGHGRISNWTVAVYNLIGHPKAQEWKNLRRLIHVHRIRKTKKGISHTDSFYISDLFQTQAQWFHQGIRGH